MKAKNVFLILVVLMMASTVLATTDLYVISTQRDSITKFDVDTGVQTVWWAMNADIKALAEHWAECTDPEEPCGHTP